jgi:nucleoside-diphosphate-sugar epimerase
MKNALVTGASGFLGGHLVAALCRAGVPVRALVRPTSNLHRLGGVETVAGDMSDPDSLVRACQGRQVVFHVAAKVPDWGPRQEFFRVNADGTAALVAACQAAGVERLVMVSSLTVLGLPRCGAQVDEDTPYDPCPRDAYTASKIVAERIVLGAHGGRGLSTVVVRPGAIWGPGDVHIAPRMAALLRMGRALYIDGSHNVVALSHVDNLVEGLMLAAESGLPGVYHLTDGQRVTARELIDGLAALLGTPKPHLSIPFAMVYAAACVMEDSARLLHRPTPPLLTRYGVRLVASHCLYNNRKAERDLGYRPRVGWREGLAALAPELQSQFPIVSNARTRHD